MNREIQFGIKPCLHCGKEASLIVVDDCWFQVICGPGGDNGDGCGAHGPLAPYEEKDDIVHSVMYAVETWKHGASEHCGKPQR